jgi:hypothetical protein
MKNTQFKKAVLYIFPEEHSSDNAYEMTLQPVSFQAKCVFGSYSTLINVLPE